eukprot:2478725-Rhodomonas_salina.1
MSPVSRNTWGYPGTPGTRVPTPGTRTPLSQNPGTRVPGYRVPQYPGTQVPGQWQALAGATNSIVPGTRYKMYSGGHVFLLLPRGPPVRSLHSVTGTREHVHVAYDDSDHPVLIPTRR